MKNPEPCPDCGCIWTMHKENCKIMQADLIKIRQRVRDFEISDDAQHRRAGSSCHKVSGIWNHLDVNPQWRSRQPRPVSVDARIVRIHNEQPNP